MTFFKKLSISGWLVIVSAVCALIGMLIYFVTATTGYIASVEPSWDVLPVQLSIIAVVLACIFVLFKGLNKPWISTIIFYAIVSLLIASFVSFVMARIFIFSDVYFVPLVPPASEVVTANLTIVGIAFYILAIVTIILAAFGKSLTKK